MPILCCAFSSGRHDDKVILVRMEVVLLCGLDVEIRVMELLW